MPSASTPIPNPIPLQPQEYPQVHVLLTQCGLPTTDLSSAAMTGFWGIRHGPQLVAVIAMQAYGGDALLRSLAVDPAYRGRGLADALVDHVEQHAQAHGLHRVVLLTQTAQAWFERRGYGVIARDMLAQAIRQSAEFRTLCPDSAACLVKTVRPYHLLVLCTGNSARSIMAEALINTMGNGRFRAFSAGSHPTGKVNPFAIELVASTGYPVDQLRSKSWDEFAQPGAPAMDFILTVCDNAAGEVCPVWPGQPISAHWGFADPAAVQGTDSERRAAFQTIFRQILWRVQLFVHLPLALLDQSAIKREMQAIGDKPV